MARPLRVEYPGAFYHVTNRGNAGEDIFINLILQKGRKKNMVRDVAICLSRELTGASGVNLGKYFGNISGAGITVRYNHLARQIQSNHKLRRQIKRIRSKIINN